MIRPAQDDEKPLEAQDKRLTLQKSRNAFLMPLCLALLSAAYGLYKVANGDKMQAGISCFVLLSQLLNMPALWGRYRLIKQGHVVYIDTASQSPSVPKAVSAVVALALTGIVGVSSAVAVLIFYTNFNTLGGWAVAGLLVLPLWLYTSYCWYRIVCEKRQIVPSILQKQPEGVWPPAPQVPKNE